MRGLAVELTHEEYRTVWHVLGLGARHWNMDLPGLPELTESERRAQVGNTLDGLRARRLADRRGVTPDVEDAIRLLAHPALEINGSVHAGTTAVRLLAGSRGEWAVLAMLDEHRLLVRTCRARELCAAVAIQLPERPAGPGSSVSVPSELLAQPTPDGKPGLTGQQLENRLVRGGVKAEDARSFAAMIRGPKPGGGFFGAARRDRNGRHTAAATLVYLLTERGGYTVQPVRGPGRQGVDHPVPGHSRATRTTPKPAPGRHPPRLKQSAVASRYYVVQTHQPGLRRQRVLSRPVHLRR